MEWWLLWNWSVGFSGTPINGTPWAPYYSLTPGFFQQVIGVCLAAVWLARGICQAALASSVAQHSRSSTFRAKTKGAPSAGVDVYVLPVAKPAPAPGMGGEGVCWDAWQDIIINRYLWYNIMNLADKNWKEAERRASNDNSLTKKS